MSKPNFYYVIVIDICRDRLLSHRLCFSQAEARKLQAQWRKEFYGYYVEFFKY